MVRQREEGEHTDEELLERFKALDSDNSGKVRHPNLATLTLTLTLTVTLTLIWQRSHRST